MTHRCFFVNEVKPGDEIVTVTRDVAHHMESVLRLKAGDSVELRDGKGRAWLAVVADVAGERARLRLGEALAIRKESPLELVLALALARSDRMDLVLRQAAEMGAHGFVSFRAQRSQYDLSGARAGKKVERWTKIAREALCQCGRLLLPEITLLSDVQELLRYATTWERDEAQGGSSGESLKILAWEGEGHQGLMDLWRRFPEPRRLLVAVGPEGGWTRDEAASFMAAGFHAVHLGPRVLRFETAAAALLAMTQLLWGDFGETHREGQEP